MSASVKPKMTDTHGTSPLHGSGGARSGGGLRQAGSTKSPQLGGSQTGQCSGGGCHALQSGVPGAQSGQKPPGAASDHQAGGKGGGGAKGGGSDASDSSGGTGGSQQADQSDILQQILAMLAKLTGGQPGSKQGGQPQQTRNV